MAILRSDQNIGEKQSDDDVDAELEKDYGTGIGLAVLFGPFGLLYSSVPGALAMLVIYPAVALLTMGAGIVIVHPLCILAAISAINNHNKRIRNQR